ncbi:MAG: hypothetical protein IT381_19810 [Deltaproteobacteria bacterium]|nr:hypothetical protein [Deltaproteobacteria bacterium]
MSETSAKAPWYKNPMTLGVLAGVAYGLIVQAAARTGHLKEVIGVMSLGFVFVLPFALGFLTTHWGGYKQNRSFSYYLFAPSLTAMASMICAIAIGWEGLICLVLATPVYLFMGAVGGFFAWVFHRVLAAREAETRLPVLMSALVIVAPPLTAFYESGQTLPLALHKVHTEIAVHASRDKVWEKIIRVEPIVEETTGFFYHIGFPKPIEASLSQEGVGGVRHARFEKDLVFIETVDEWVDKERLSFAIDVDPSATPLTTLDPHVTVGGTYFDVMRGTYWIEARGQNEQVLHLESEFRLSTAFNRYAGFWGDFLMRDIQTSILRVIKARCEAP